jgi:MYXO-CTERM domain-containing protein
VVMRYAPGVKRALATLAAIGALTVSSTALANGRFPESNHIFFSQADTNIVLLRTTFGLLLSRDRGATWSWVCEQSIGSAGVEDPMWAVTPDGTMVATTFQGITVTHDKACTFGFVGGALAQTVFIDLAQNAADEKNVVTFASSYDKQDDAGNVLFKSQLFETTDQAQTFVPLGQTFDPTLLGETVDLAPNDPNRIYVSAVRNPGATPQGYLLVSTDHGTTFTTYDVPLIAGERAVFIAGVDPTNADRVYLRTSTAIDKPSRLLVTADAGKTFTTAMTSKGGLLGFAISADGSKVWVGGPLDGVQLASRTDMVFTQKSTVAVQCLATGSDGLWACSGEKDGFVAGLSTDDGATFQAKLHFCDIKGALDCPAGTPTNTACTAAWPQQAQILGCEVPGVDGGTGDASPDAATTPPPGDGGSGGCSCRAAPASASAFGATLAAIGALVAFVRRKRRFKE